MISENRRDWAGRVRHRGREGQGKGESATGTLMSTGGSELLRPPEQMACLPEASGKVGGLGHSTPTSLWFKGGTNLQGHAMCVHTYRRCRVLGMPAEWAPMGRPWGTIQRWVHSGWSVWLKVNLNFHGTALMALSATGSRLRGCDLGTRVPC